MHIKNFDITISEDDLNKLITRFAPTTEKISNLRASLHENRLSITGRVKLLFAVNFSAEFRLSHSQNEIIAKLEAIRPLNALTSQFKDKILQKIVKGVSFARLDAKNDALLFDINSMMKNYVADSDLVVEALSVREKKINLRMNGRLMV
jgi:hypothetical protein